MDEQGVEKDGVSSLHLQVDTRVAGVIVHDTVVHLVHTTLKKNIKIKTQLNLASSCTNHSHKNKKTLNTQYRTMKPSDKALRKENKRHNSGHLRKRTTIQLRII